MNPADVDVDRHADDDHHQHRDDPHHRFSVWAVACGLAKPERLTEAVLREAEVES